MEIIEATWLDNKAYFLARGKEFLSMLVDDKPLWTDKPERAWYSPNRENIEEVMLFLGGTDE